MTKPSPIAIIALSILAISILAFTINEELKKGKKDAGGIAMASKNSTGKSPFIAAYNPAHGQPGHRHDLPDGALLPNSAPLPVATPSNELALNNTASQPASEISAATAINPAHGEPGHNCAISVGAPLNSTPINTGNTNTVNSSKIAEKNPAHGQPGHRCDIAVGASLNSAPAKTTTPATNITTTTPVVSNMTTNNKGLNPAHGQPGHRCDIGVGEPLNTPVKNTATTTPTTTTTNSNTLNPSVFPNYNFPKKDSASSPKPQFQYDSTGAALNPAHGQPGHDCSIAVGKPLKK